MNQFNFYAKGNSNFLKKFYYYTKDKILHWLHKQGKQNECTQRLKLCDENLVDLFSPESSKNKHTCQVLLASQSDL